MSDPSRKPSRVRAAESAAEDAVQRRAPKKEGWAKAKPKFEHAKTFKPRARPEAAEGERGERPKRIFKPREDQFIDKPREGPRGARGGARRDAGDKPTYAAKGGAKSGGRGFGKPSGGASSGPRAGGRGPRTPR